MAIEITCSLIKHDGDIIGISLVPDNDRIAENFCQAILQQIMQGSAWMKVEDTMALCFVDDHGTEVAFHLSDTDGENIKTLLEEGFMLCREKRLGPGFRVTKIGMERMGKKHPLIRTKEKVDG